MEPAITSERQQPSTAFTEGQAQQIALHFWEQPYTFHSGSSKLLYRKTYIPEAKLRALPNSSPCCETQDYLSLPTGSALLLLIPASHGHPRSVSRPSPSHAAAHLLLLLRQRAAEHCTGRLFSASFYLQKIFFGMEKATGGQNCHPHHLVLGRSPPALSRQAPNVLLPPPTSTRSPHSISGLFRWNSPQFWKTSRKRHGKAVVSS